MVIQIPYRSLLPNEVDNLIVTGRCISAEREVLGAIRVMGPCVMMGQAAGTATAMVVKAGNNCFDKVSVEGLRAQLWEDGVLNPEELPFE